MINAASLDQFMSDLDHYIDERVEHLRHRADQETDFQLKEARRSLRHSLEDLLGIR